MDDASTSSLHLSVESTLQPSEHAAAQPSPTPLLQPPSLSPDMMLVHAPSSPFDFGSAEPPMMQPPNSLIDPFSAAPASPLFDSSATQPPLSELTQPMHSSQFHNSAATNPLLLSPLPPTMPTWGVSSTDSLGLGLPALQPQQRPPSSTPLSSAPLPFLQPAWGINSTDSFGSQFGAYRDPHQHIPLHQQARAAARGGGGGHTGAQQLTTAFTTATTDSGPDSGDEELAQADNDSWQPPQPPGLSQQMSFEDSNHASPGGVWSEEDANATGLPALPYVSQQQQQMMLTSPLAPTSEHRQPPYAALDSLSYSAHSSTALQINQRHHEAFAAAGFTVGPATLAYQDFNSIAYKTPAPDVSAQLQAQQQLQQRQQQFSQQPQQPPQSQSQPQTQSPSHPPPSTASKKKKAAAAASAPSGPAPVVSKRACIPCRKLKACCDDCRPCTRCTKFGRECIDRSEEEVDAAKERRKRTRAPTAPDGTPMPSTSSRKKKSDRAAAAAAAAAAAPADPQAQAAQAAYSSGSSSHSHSHPSSPSVHSPVVTSPGLALSRSAMLRPGAGGVGSSRELYSRLVLNAAIRQGHRDAILNLHVLLQSAPPHLAALLQWHTQVQLSLVNFADFLTEADFLTFLTHGLTQSQLDSPAWLTSPLAPWVKLSTRTMHFAWQNSTASCDPGSMIGSQHSTDSSDPSGILAQFKFDFLPAANSAFQSFERMASARSAHQRRLREAASGISAPAVPCPISALGDLSLLTSKQKRQVLTTLASTTLVKEGSPGSSIEEIGALVDLLSCLNVGRALTDWRPEHDERRHGPQAHHAHAVWCPMSQLADRGKGVFAVDADDEGHRRKKGTTHEAASSGAGGAGSSSTPSSAHSSAASSCLCELSTALPVRMQVNSAFERLFGWSQAEIQRGVESEGMSWIRNLYPPSIWPALVEAQLAQRKAFFEFTTAMAQASLGSSPAAAAAAAAVQSAPDPHIVPLHHAAPAAGCAPLSTSEHVPDVLPPTCAKSEPRDLGPFPHMSHTLVTEVQNKWGAVLPAILVKHTAIANEGDSEGGNVTGFVYSWEVVQHRM